MNALRQLTIYQRLLVNALLMLIGIAVLCSSTLYYTYDAMLQSRRDATREHPRQRPVQLAIEELGFFTQKVNVLGVYPADKSRVLK